MPHALRRVPRVAGGFTLIELLVALLLIGIILGFAVLSVGDPWSGRVDTEARRFAALVDLASEEALLQSREIGVHFAPEGYQFLVFAGEGWQPVDDRLLRPRQLPEGMELELIMDGIPVALRTEETELTPQVILFSSGERIPFVLTLAPPDRRFHYRIEGPLLGRPQLEGPLES